MINSGPGHREILAAASFLAILLSPVAPAQSQSTDPTRVETPAVAPGSPVSGAGTEAAPASPGSAPAASAAEAVPLQPVGDPVDSNLVDVSLGDWELKNELASQLKVKVSQIPLTVAVPSDIASRACPIGNDELDQQKVTSATRTCAAKQLTDELRDEVRSQLRETSAN